MKRIALIAVFCLMTEVAFAEDEYFYCGFITLDTGGQDYAKWSKGKDFKYNQLNKRWEWVDEFSAQYIYPDGRYEQIEKTAGMGNHKGVCNAEMEAIDKRKVAEIQKKYKK